MIEIEHDRNFYPSYQHIFHSSSLKSHQTITPPNSYLHFIKYPCLLQLLTKSSALTIWQATLQHTKNNVAPMPEIEKGEGTTRLPHLPLFVAPAPQMTAKKEKECFERKANTNMR
jgi:hypothetical protein